MKKILLIIFLIFVSCEKKNQLTETVEFIKACWVYGESDFEFNGIKIKEENCCEACVSFAMNLYFDVDFDVTKNQWWYDMRKLVKKSDANKEKLLSLHKALVEEAVKIGDVKFKKMSDSIVGDILD